MHKAANLVTYFVSFESSLSFYEWVSATIWIATGFNPWTNREKPYSCQAKGWRFDIADMILLIKPSSLR